MLCLSARFDISLQFAQQYRWRFAGRACLQPPEIDAYGAIKNVPATSPCLHRRFRMLRQIAGWATPVTFELADRVSCLLAGNWLSYGHPSDDVDVSAFVEA